MSPKETPRTSAAELRQRAEAMARQQYPAWKETVALSAEQTQQTLHELRVHQFQLEMQNEELRRTQAELDATRNRYFDLYDLAPVGYLTLSPSGVILEANLTAATLLGVARGALAGKTFTRFISRQDQDCYYLNLRSDPPTGAPHRCELRLQRADGTLFWAQLVSTPLEQIDGHCVTTLVLSDISDRKAVEEVLKESEARFRQLLANVSSVAVQGYGPDGTTQYWNKASERLYGYSAAEALGRNLVDLIIPPQARAEVHRAIQWMAATGQPIPPGELTLMRKDGTLVDVFSSHAIIRKSGPSGGQELFCIDIDLTERKQAEEALRESEERYRLLFESASDAIFLIAIGNTRILKANRRAAELYGYTPEELLGKQAGELSAQPGETSRRIRESRDRPDQVISVAHRLHRKKDGTVFPVEITARTVPFVGESVLLVAIRDISDRKQAEEALEKSEQLYRSLVNNLQDGFWVADGQGFLTFANEALARILGFAGPGQLLGRSILDLVEPSARAWVGSLLAEAVPAGTIPELIEVAMVKTDGTVVPTEIRPALLCHGDGTVALQGLLMDISRRKWQEEQLKAAKEDLERRVEQRTRELQETQKQYLHAEKLSAIGKLSASIAHEFNNPLQGILSILKGLRKRAILETEDRELLEAAIHESDRIKELIRSLQEFNRPTSGNIAVMDLHKTIDSLLLLHKSDFKGRRISVELDYAPLLPQIFAVPDQIKQVLLNLLTNAADACQQPGGTITIRTRREGDRVSVSIKDTGIGIEPEALERIFQPFYTTKAAVKGTGLGLSVSHGIITSHQGEIQVESRPGAGATFTVLLPIHGQDR